jgi:HEAT repeat protein
MLAPAVRVSLLAAIVALPSFGAGAYSQRGSASVPEAVPAQAKVAHASAEAPRTYPRDAAALRTQLDPMRPPAELAEVVRRLGIVGEDSDIDRLDPLLAHPSSMVRAETLYALGRIGGATAAERLLATADSPHPDAWVAIAALGFDRSHDAFAALAQIGRGADMWKRQSAWAALAVRGGEDARRLLHTGLRKAGANDASALAAAVAALGGPRDRALLIALSSTEGPAADASFLALAQLPGRDVADALLRAAESARGPRRYSAIVALGQLDDPRAVDRLADAALTDTFARSAAIMALGESPRPEAGGVLRAVLDSASLPLPARSEAAMALARRREPDGRDYLADLAATDDLLARPALAALAAVQDQRVSALWLARLDRTGELPSADALPALAASGAEGWMLVEEVIAEGPADARQAAVWALQQQGGDDAVERLLDLASGDDRGMAAAATGALETMGGGARDGLRKLLAARVREGEDDLYGSNLQALARLGGDEAREAIFARLDGGTASERNAAFAALSQLDDDAAVEKLEALAAPGADPNVRASAVATLLARGDDPARIDAALSDAEPSIRAQGVSALAQQRGPGAVKELSELVSDPDPSVRQAALYALGETGSKAAEGALRCALTDPTTADAALYGLGRIGTESAWDSVREAARSAENPAIRASAMSALAQDPSAGSTDALTAALADPAPEIASAAVWALQSRGSGAASMALADTLVDLADVTEDDPRFGLRMTVASALRALGGSEARELSELLDEIVGPDGGWAGGYYDGSLVSPYMHE